MSTELLQIAQLVVGGMLLPAAYGCVIYLFQVERRLSHIEGQLKQEV